MRMKMAVSDKVDFAVLEKIEAAGQKRQQKRSAFVTALAIRLRDLRLQGGLSQADLAKRLGVTAARISSYEAGAAIPMARLPALALALGGAVADLLAPAPPPAAAFEGAGSAKRRVQLMKDYAALPQQLQVAVCDFAHNLLAPS